MALTHKKLGITKDILATKVIPHLFPLVIDSNLNLAQVDFIFVFLASHFFFFFCKKYHTTLEMVRVHVHVCSIITGQRMIIHFTVTCMLSV